ncbi:MAG: hypothetical protein Q8P95_05255 [bacterium]|nr:hypothetical protein [bacterium]
MNEQGSFWQSIARISVQRVAKGVAAGAVVLIVVGVSASRAGLLQHLGSGALLSQDSDRSNFDEYREVDPAADQERSPTEDLNRGFGDDYSRDREYDRPDPYDRPFGDRDFERERREFEGERHEFERERYEFEGEGQAERVPAGDMKQYPGDSSVGENIFEPCLHMEEFASEAPIKSQADVKAIIQKCRSLAEGFRKRGAGGERISPEETRQAFEALFERLGNLMRNNFEDGNFKNDMAGVIENMGSMLVAGGRIEQGIEKVKNLLQDRLADVTDEARKRGLGQEHAQVVEKLRRALEAARGILVRARQALADGDMDQVRRLLEDDMEQKVHQNFLSLLRSVHIDPDFIFPDDHSGQNERNERGSQPKEAMVRPGRQEPAAGYEYSLQPKAGGAGIGFGISAGDVLLGGSDSVTLPRAEYEKLVKLSQEVNRQGIGLSESVAAKQFVDLQLLLDNPDVMKQVLRIAVERVGVGAMERMLAETKRIHEVATHQADQVSEGWKREIYAQFDPKRNQFAPELADSINRFLEVSLPDIANSKDAWAAANILFEKNNQLLKNKGVNAYSDLNIAHWSSQAAVEMNQEGIITGKDGGQRFDAAGQVTCDELSVVAMRVLRRIKPDLSSGAGADVNGFASWAQKDAAALQHLLGVDLRREVCGGREPSAPVTRQAIAQVLYHLTKYLSPDVLGKVDQNVLQGFTDRASFSNQSAIALVAHLGLMGKGNDVFRANDPTNRGELAEIFRRFLTPFGGEAIIDPPLDTLEDLCDVKTVEEVDAEIAAEKQHLEDIQKGLEETERLLQDDPTNTDLQEQESHLKSQERSSQQKIDELQEERGNAIDTNCDEWGEGESVL